MTRTFPKIGLTVEIEVPGVGMVPRGIVHVRQNGDDTVGLTLMDAEGQPEFVTIKPTRDGWVCVRPAVDVRHAAFVAECVRDGVTLHGPASQPEQVLAQALLQVLGLGQPSGPACRLRMDEVAL